MDIPKYLNPRYTAAPLVAFNYAAFSCIALVVFLTATQPFYLLQVVGVKPENIGAVIGTLGALDEIVAMISAPLMGTLNDRINNWAWEKPGLPAGTRIVVMGLFTALGVALVGYGQFAQLAFPDLWFWRALFAVGVSGTMSMVTVMLHEATNSDFTWRRFVFWRLAREHEREGEDLPILDHSPKPGNISALLGVMTGLGAVFSVACFLPLPVKLEDWYPEIGSRKALKISYVILGSLAILSGVLVSSGAYDCVKRRRVSSRSIASEAPKQGYWRLLTRAVGVSRDNRQLQVAYAGAFVARATTVATSVFIPLMVYKFFTNSGICDTELPSQDTCYDGYVFLAILTGVAQTVALVLSPLWGYLVNKLGSRQSLVGAALVGLVGNLGLCIAGSETLNLYDPRNAMCFVLVSMIGISQIGAIIASMSLLAGVGKAAYHNEHQVIGAILGLYSLCGGLGILVVSKIGGSWSDKWAFSPFLLLGVCDILLAGASFGAGFGHVLI